MDKWDSRFVVSPSRGNQIYHEFFRQYFDKPSKRDVKKICLPTEQRLYESPNLKSSLDKLSSRIPRSSRAWRPFSRKLEKN